MAMLSEQSVVDKLAIGVQVVQHYARIAGMTGSEDYYLEFLRQRL